MLLRGQRAWLRIKATAAEQRELWRQVGEALNYGRALYPSNQAFGAWCKAEGFDMDPSLRSNAMWLAENWTVVLGSPQHGLTNPGDIRKAYRAQAPAPTPDLTLEPSAPLPDLQAIAKQARKIHALANSAAAGDETAKRRQETNH